MVRRLYSPAYNFRCFGCCVVVPVFFVAVRFVFAMVGSEN